MRVEGYKLKGYDATYEKCMFDIIEHKGKESQTRVLEVTEINSGLCFIFDYNNVKKSRTKPRKKNKC